MQGRKGIMEDEYAGYNGDHRHQIGEDRTLGGGDFPDGIVQQQQGHYRYQNAQIAYAYPQQRASPYRPVKFSPKNTGKLTAPIPI